MDLDDLSGGRMMLGIGTGAQKRCADYGLTDEVNDLRKRFRSEGAGAFAPRQGGGRGSL